MSLKDKLMAKSAGVRAQVDAELAKAPVEKTAHPRTAIGHAGAFQVEISKSQDRIRELEDRVADLENTAIPVNDVAPNPWQPRRIFDEKEIQKLATSIEDVGLIQPIVVRRVQTLDTEVCFELVAGERRLRAHKVLGRETIKAIVIDVSNDDMAVMALVENIDRQDLSDYEIAKAIRRAEVEFPNRKHMAQALGMERSDLYRYLAFDALPEDVKSDLEIEPRTLGRAAAAAIEKVIKANGGEAMDIVSKVWTRVKSGDLDQGKIAHLIELSLLRKQQPQLPAAGKRDIRKLFIGKEQSGSITRDAAKLQVTIKSSALTPEKEEQLRQFVEKLFSA